MEDNLLRWVGGKKNLAPFIIGKMPFHKIYVEVFAGAANVYWQKPLAPQFNVINDINNDLSNLYFVISDSYKADKMVKKLMEMFYSRNIFEQLRDSRQNNRRLWDMTPDWNRAAIYTYLNKYSYNGEFRSFSASETAVMNMNKIKLIVEQMTKKLTTPPGTLIENTSFENIIKQWDKPDTLMYLDPPYWVTTGKGGGYYEYVMDKKQHEQLKFLLLNLKSAKFLLSYDDVPEIRKMYNEQGVYMINTPSLAQSCYARQVGQKEDAETIVKSELLIANYPINNINTLFDE